jgi:hypothetical protein
MDQEPLPEEMLRLKSSAIITQMWHKDKSFHRCIKNGRERGFTDIADYVTRSNEYRAQVGKRKINKAAGERASTSYTLAGAWNRLLPAVWIIGALVFFIYGMSNHIFFPDNGQHIFSLPDKTATATAQAKTTAVAIAQLQHVSAPTLNGTKVPVINDSGFGNILDNVTGGVAVGLVGFALLLFLLSKLIGKMRPGKKKRSQNEDTPAPNLIYIDAD